jgi:hypothetical protein
VALTTGYQKIEHILDNVDYSRSLPEPLLGAVNKDFRESYMALIRKLPDHPTKFHGS